MGQLLRTERDTATGKQSQVLIAAVNRHMPATAAWGNRLRIKDANEVTILMRQLTTKNMAKALTRPTSRHAPAADRGAFSTREGQAHAGGAGRGGSGGQSRRGRFLVAAPPVADLVSRTRRAL